MQHAMHISPSSHQRGQQTHIPVGHAQHTQLISHRAMLVYPRAELLALRKLPHVAERGPEKRTGDVVPDGMPQLGEGIG